MLLNESPIQSNSPLEIRSANFVQQQKGILKDFVLQQIELFFGEHNHNQLILDSLNDSLINSKAVKGNLLNKGVIELSPEKLGLNKSEKSQKKAIKKVEQDYEAIKAKLITGVNTVIDEWFTNNPQEEITTSRLEIIKQIFSILLGHSANTNSNLGSWIALHGKTKQLSESTFKWIVTFALETTKSNSTNSAYESFNMINCIGADQVPPPYVESYVVELLVKLAQLNQLKNEAKIQFIPKLIILSSLHSQLVENNKDKEGDLINPFLHLYNARITMERLSDFIKNFFPNLISYCHFVEFPAYQKYSLGRLFFGSLWKSIPMDKEKLNKMFAIKGNVQEENTPDLLKQLLGEDTNPYVTRHLFSNGVLARSNTLRFGSAFTEPQFHITTMSLSSLLQIKGKEIAQSTLNSAQQLSQLLLSQNDSEAMKNCDFLEENEQLEKIQLEMIIKSQISALPPSGKIHAQIGMNTHACYYKHSLESSLAEIVKNRQHSAQKLRQEKRADKAEKLENSFTRTADLLGKNMYIDFLSNWHNQYLTKDTDNQTILSNNFAQIERILELIENSQTTKNLLNYHL